MYHKEKKEKIEMRYITNSTELYRENNQLLITVYIINIMSLYSNI